MTTRSLSLRRRQHVNTVVGYGENKVSRRYFSHISIWLPSRRRAVLISIAGCRKRLALGEPSRPRLLSAALLAIRGDPVGGFWGGGGTGHPCKAEDFSDARRLCSLADCPQPHKNSRRMNIHRY